MHRPLKLYTCLFLLILIAALCYPAFSQVHAQNAGAALANNVKVTGGTISGSQVANGIRVYKGIPFAAAPVGELRWKEPQPVKPWSGVRPCTTFGPSPMQREPAPFSMWSAEFLIQKEPISEDCLYLNVWTGAKSAREKRPVIVWIYGGGFNSGGTNVPIYDGEAMAQKGVVFVSLNYRVGIFGFFAHPALTRESGRNASGNYGLLDQVAGLRWVQQNISAFGGDPQNVTIAGQSAGSMSVNCLVASPLAKNLFKKAIAQSGASFIRKSLSLAQAEQEGVEMAGKLNAPTLVQLRNLPAAELQQKGQGSRPIVDGYFLPADIADIFAAGKANAVALLTGWNENEGLSGPIRNAADFRKQLETEYSTNAKTFLQYYPAANDQEAEIAQQNLSRDLIFGLQNYTWANVQAQQGKQPVFVYRFTRLVPATGEYKKYGAFHTGEVPYAYDNLKFVDRPWEPADHYLAKLMSGYWVNFATKGNPNGPGLPEWPVYTLPSKKIMILDQKPVTQEIPDRAALDFLYKATVKN
ncbi:carboxylic ester hydrolase [Adhaeribacter aerolatus]|uniref:Carboxylic ester hydrolase n=1 Tax=Adhaeribacter aerolatus TaxID=670289 RepID=A0A512B4Y3_9BACT|nr:carboxylesterase family protein [Adhaeribacter aerolatus]GEO07036.1 carboxylic ester hydrolase [Adhaeribacter aerolatus]